MPPRHPRSDRITDRWAWAIRVDAPTSAARVALVAACVDVGGEFAALGRVFDNDLGSGVAVVAWAPQCSVGSTAIG
ncbi:hypothetical protein [Nocardia sp. NPDC060249]|uniref:hypothetical protein n=1 Tax=Nocardia sp. NPDC060249 TaxID=3347082 RepID=UPI00366A4D11